MSTLGEMKETIASEIMRDDLTDAIAKEIDKAIKFYRSKRFWFTEKLATVTFSTVADQTQYTSTASSYIPDLIRIDSMTITRNGSVTDIEPISELDMKLLLGGVSPLSNPPTYYSYYGQLLNLYPVPDGAYPIVIAGVVHVAAPATDGETGNPWMNEAEELIRCRAKRNLYLHWMSDRDEAGNMATAESEALSELQKETSSRSQVSRLTPCDL